MAFVQILAVGNRNGTSRTVSRAVPADLASVAIRLDLPRTAVPNPFTDPAMQIDLIVEVSYDGASTWSHFVGGLIRGGALMRDGSPNIIFRKELPPAPDPYPTHARAGYTITDGPISMGISLEII